MEKQVVQELLEEYRAHPCLWDVKCGKYHNKTEKNLALEKLKNIWSKVEPDCSVNDTKIKINNLRTAWRKELKKVKDCEKSGAGVDEVYVPKLYYFDQLTFLKDIDGESRRMVNPENVEEEEPEQEEVRRPLKKKNKAEEDLLMKVANKVTREDENTSFGEYVAGRLRSHKKEQAVYVRKLINDAIYYGELQGLNVTSNIVTQNLEVTIPCDSE